VRALADSPVDFGLLGSKVPHLPGTPMNRRTKFDAASFILGGEFRNRTKANECMHV